MTVTTPTPIYRIEHFLDAVVNETENMLDPISPLELYLAKLAGRDVTIPAEPITRIEWYLAKVCGEEVTLQPPVFRAEMWLAKWAGYEYPDEDGE